MRHSNVRTEWAATEGGLPAVHCQAAGMEASGRTQCAPSPAAGGGGGGGGGVQVGAQGIKNRQNLPGEGFGPAASVVGAVVGPQSADPPGLTSAGSPSKQQKRIK